jgi:hypothetical protein
MTFTYPEDLVRTLHKAWDNRDYPEQFIPDLPPDEQIRRFLEVAYHASMLTEEQRKIGFRLAFISPDTALQLAGPVELGRLFEPVRFEVSRDFSVPEILRLAPATDHTKVLICVSPLNSNGEASVEGSLRIWGLIDTGSSWLEFTTGQSKTGVPPPNCLTVSSIEPGNLTFSREGTVLLSLKRGETVTPSRETLYQGPIAAVLKDAGDAITRDACVAIGEEQYETGSNGQDFPRRFYFRFLERLLFHIREKLHGGALLVVPDTRAADDPRLTRLVMIKYPCDYDHVWSLLVNSLALRAKHHKLHFEIYRSGSQIPIEKYHQFASLETQREVIDRRISDSVRLIASTSGVDGAVIITDRFRLIGFGAEITTLAPLREVHIARDHTAKKTTTVTIESYGTRHRSAFRFCWEDEESVAFVVSQDGGVKGVKRVGDRLIFWPDINFGPLGI